MRPHQHATETNCDDETIPYQYDEEAGCSRRTNYDLNQSRIRGRPKVSVQEDAENVQRINIYQERAGEVYNAIPEFQQQLCDHLDVLDPSAPETAEILDEIYHAVPLLREKLARLQRYALNYH